MSDRLTFLWNRLQEQLWFRPLLYCILSVVAALLAKLADGSEWHKHLPAINKSAVEELLTTLSSSMLVIAVFAVGSMINAFSAASNSATPRSFSLIVRDDVSQTAMSVFIGAFIYGIVATVALKNEYYGKTGIFILFALTLLVFLLVIITFLRWVDRISRLGRMGQTIDKIETAAAKALAERIKHPWMGGAPATPGAASGIAVAPQAIGYVQQVNMPALQKAAEKQDCRIVLACLPGSFLSPGTPMAYVTGIDVAPAELTSRIAEAIQVEKERIFDQDPRFGLITLSEIASRALSAAINDPGTAIAIIGSQLRLLHLFEEKAEPGFKLVYDRVDAPGLEMADLFDDAFRPMSRDGAAHVEVMLRLQKALGSLATSTDTSTKTLAISHARRAYERAAKAMVSPDDLALVKAAMPPEA